MFTQLPWPGLHALGETVPQIYCFKGEAPGSGEKNYILQEEVTVALHLHPTVKGPVTLAVAFMVLLTDMFTALLTLESRAFFSLTIKISRQGMKAQACLGMSHGSVTSWPHRGPGGE